MTIENDKGIVDNRNNIVDLDAARAARNEAKKVQFVVRFGGEDFTLPQELPMDTLEPLMEMQEVGAILEKEGEQEVSPATQVAMVKALSALTQSLLGEEQFARFKAHQPSMDDFHGFVDGALGSFGVNQGNSGASAES